VKRNECTRCTQGLLGWALRFPVNIRPLPRGGHRKAERSKYREADVSAPDRGEKAKGLPFLRLFAAPFPPPAPLAARWCHPGQR